MKTGRRCLGRRVGVGVLGMGVPRLACLRPMAWLCERARTTHLHQQTSKTLARGQASRGGQQEASSGATSSGGVARRRRDQGRDPSRGARDASHDDQDQAGASTRSVLVSSLVLRRQSAGDEYRGSRQRFPYWCNETKTSRTAGRRSPWSPRRSPPEPLASEDHL